MNTSIKIPNNSWSSFFRTEIQKNYFVQLMQILDEEYQNWTIFPSKNETFTAFELTPLDECQVVILGQDPYHKKGQAHGLAFSVPDGVKIPPSLRNIYKEIEDELGMSCCSKSGNLKNWATHGVFLLNTVLTVRKGEANSHKNIGWEIFTDNCIKALNKEDRPIVFMLWGQNAMSKRKLLNNPKHMVLVAAHPSPLSAYRGFFGCGHFVQCNEFLRENGKDEIQWIC